VRQGASTWFLRSLTNRGSSNPNHGSWAPDVVRLRTSMSVTGLIRKLDGTDSVVNMCSNQYLAGMITGVIYQATQ